MTERTKYYKVDVLVEFGWLKTDNFYMNIGGSTKLGLMGCGDDQGSTWIYKLPAWLDDDDDDSDQPLSLPQKILPIGNFILTVESFVNHFRLGRLPWPDLGPEHTEDGETMLGKEYVCSLSAVRDFFQTRWSSPPVGSIS